MWVRPRVYHRLKPNKQSGSLQGGNYLMEKMCNRCMMGRVLSAIERYNRSICEDGARGVVVRAKWMREG